MWFLAGMRIFRAGEGAEQKRKAFEAFKKSYPKLSNWKLKLIGPIEEEFKEYINNFYNENPNLKNIVEFTGPIYDRKQLADEYNKAKIFCLTSRYESFGL